MKNQKSLKETLKKLAKLQFELDEKGGPTKDGSLFEKILNIQDDFLTSFGLPIKPEYERILYFYRTPTEADLEEKIIQLHGFASEYLSTSPSSEIKVLKDAQELNKDPFDVLPELGIPTHSYTLYIYNKILLQKKDTLKNVLEEFNYVSQNRELLNVIGELEEKDFFVHPEELQPLVGKDLKYICLFMNSVIWAS